IEDKVVGHSSVKSISGLDTWRKLHGLPAARTRASAIDNTSYGGAITSFARPGADLSPRNGLINVIAISPDQNGMSHSSIEKSWQISARIERPTHLPPFHFRPTI